MLWGGGGGGDLFMRSRNLYVPKFCSKLGNLQKLVKLLCICHGTTCKVIGQKRLIKQSLIKEQYDS